MANTNGLKKIVEPDLINSFKQKYGCELISLPSKSIKNIFLEMEPDLIGFDKENCVLFIGEITTSGYFGQRGKNFHIGAVRKLAEAFSKFYLFHMEENREKIFRNIQKVQSNVQPQLLSCHFIVPERSRFIKALGYRERLFQTGIMKLDELPISSNAMMVMDETLKKSIDEMS